MYIFPSLELSDLLLYINGCSNIQKETKYGSIYL